MTAWTEHAALLPDPPGAHLAGRTDLRHRILHEATRVFAERGYVSASMREVAEAASCTKPALYYHFRSKSGLFLEILTTETQAVTDLIQAAVARPDPVRDRLIRGIRMFFEHVRNHVLGLAVILRAEVHAEPEQPAFDLSSARQVHMALTRQLLEEGVASGELRSDFDVHEATLSLVAMVDQRCRLYVFDAQPIPSDAPERIVDLFFRGVAR